MEWKSHSGVKRVWEKSAETDDLQIIVISCDKKQSSILVCTTGKSVLC